jgi:hypothetical protein
MKWLTKECSQGKGRKQNERHRKFKTRPCFLLESGICLVPPQALVSPGKGEQVFFSPVSSSLAGVCSVVEKEEAVEKKVGREAGSSFRKGNFHSQKQILPKKGQLWAFRNQHRSGNRYLWGTPRFILPASSHQLTALWFLHSTPYRLSNQPASGGGMHILPS